MRNGKNAYAEGSPNRDNYKALLMSMSNAEFEYEAQVFRGIYWREFIDREERCLKMSLIEAEARRRGIKPAMNTSILMRNTKHFFSSALGMH